MNWIYQIARVSQWWPHWTRWCRLIVNWIIIIWWRSYMWIAIVQNILLLWWFWFPVTWSLACFGRLSDEKWRFKKANVPKKAFCTVCPNNEKLHSISSYSLHPAAMSLNAVCYTWQNNFFLKKCPNDRFIKSCLYASFQCTIAHKLNYLIQLIFFQK